MMRSCPTTTGVQESSRDTDRQERDTFSTLETHLSSIRLQDLPVMEPEAPMYWRLHMAPRCEMTPDGSWVEQHSDYSGQNANADGWECLRTTHVSTVQPYPSSRHPVRRCDCGGSSLVVARHTAAKSMSTIHLKVIRMSSSESLAVPENEVVDEEHEEEEEAAPNKSRKTRATE